ncbi:MAG TPA: response regulator [Bacteroidia bacterium]|nr:response regulator [Bacteroidia bacterium]
MKMKFNYVWVIDDSTIDNYITEQVLKKSGLALETSCFTEARMALISLNSLIADNKALPEVIFLDISMPVMNGFDFLDAFEKNDFTNLKQPAIVMLSSSTNQEDITRALSNNLVTNYISKPLTIDLINSMSDGLGVKK